MLRDLQVNGNAVKIRDGRATVSVNCRKSPAEPKEVCTTVHRDGKGSLGHLRKSENLPVNRIVWYVPA